MKGQGASQNATLFVMRSEISNAPNIGFTQGGGFDAVAVRNPAGWYGLGYGAIASATPTSAPNSVPNSNGVPTASYTINKANANLSSGVISNNKSFNSNSGTYTFNPINTATPTSLVNNHPGLFLNGYVGGVMVTATSATYTKPYIVTNVTGQPGNVGIYLPGDSSEMLASSMSAASMRPRTG